MAWNDTIDNTTDWSSVTFLRMFEQAIWERSKAAQQSFTAGELAAGPPTLSTAINVGTDVQQAQFIATFQSDLAGALVKFMPTDFAPGNEVLLAGTGSANQWENQRWTLASLCLSLGYTEGGWRRKRPREVTTISSTSDTQGNPAVTGQKALVLSLSQFRQFNGTSWSIASSGADVLASNSATPNSVAAGQIVAGDYIGPWLFQQLRAIANALKLTLATSQATAVNRSVISVQSVEHPLTESDSDWNVAKANAESTWDTGEPGSRLVDVSDLVLHSFSRGVNRGTAAYIAELNKGTAQWTLNANNHIPRTASFWMAARLPHNDSTQEIFDTQSDTVIQDRWANWYTTSANDKSVTTDAFSDIAVKPPVWCPQPSAGSSVSQGYSLTLPHVLIEWQFTHGPA